DAATGGGARTGSNAATDRRSGAGPDAATDGGARAGSNAATGAGPRSDAASGPGPAAVPDLRTRDAAVAASPLPFLLPPQKLTEANACAARSATIPAVSRPGGLALAQCGASHRSQAAPTRRSVFAACSLTHAGEPKGAGEPVGWPSASP